MFKFLFRTSESMGAVRSRLILALMTAATLLVAAPAALADVVSSSNWAGYAVHRSGIRFTKVLARWTQPSARCTAGHRTYSALWVGLGGYDASSDAVEQIGTEVDCTASGRVSSTAWYQLRTSTLRPIDMKVPSRRQARRQRQRHRQPRRSGAPERDHPPLVPPDVPPLDRRRLIGGMDPRSPVGVHR